MELDAAETQHWRAWKAATEGVWEQVVREITASSGLSSADFSVLTRVVELGDGRLRQQQLADELGWQRARLSRQISRMVERGLLERAVTDSARVITATAEGRHLAGVARKAHAATARAALLDVAGEDPAAGFWATIERLGPALSATSPPPAVEPVPTEAGADECPGR